MPRKVEVTPTVTEGRSKRTPKPNLKYAADFVQNIRAATPEKLDDDEADDFSIKLAPKKKVDDASPKGVATSKGKSTLQPTIRLSKSGITPAGTPKTTAVVKKPLAGKVEKKPSPAPSKLAALRTQMSRQVNSHLIKSNSKPKMDTPASRSSKLSTSETESDVDPIQTPKETPRVTRSAPAKQPEKPAPAPASAVTKSAENANAKAQFSIVDVNAIINKTDGKRKLDMSAEESKTNNKKSRNDSLIDFEDEISASNLEKSVSPMMTRKEAAKNAKASPVPTTKVEKSPAVAKKEAPTKTAGAAVASVKKEAPKTTVKSPATAAKKETLKDIKAEVTKMISQKDEKPQAKQLPQRTTRQQQKRSISPVAKADDNDDDDEDDDDEEEDSDIEAILSGEKPSKEETKKPVKKEEVKAKGTKEEATKKETPKVVSPKIVAPQLRTTTSSKQVPASKPPIRITSPPARPNIKSPGDLVKKIVKPLAESQNIKSAASSSTPVVPKALALREENPNPLNKLFTLNFPSITTQPPRAVLCISLIKLGNKIKEIKLPSLNWSYRITLQKLNKENSGDKGEVYTGDIEDSGIEESERSNYAPVNISFVRVASAEIPNSDTIKSVTFQNKSFQILIKGKQCRLIGSPQYIYDVSEIQTLLEVVEKVYLNHSYVELTEP